MDNVTDTDLLEGYYRNGDTRALEAFLARHIDYMHGQARYLVGHADKDDIVQASIIRLMDASPNGCRVNNPLGWWRSMLASSAIDHRRSVERRKRRENTFIQDLNDLPHDIETETIRSQLLEQVRFRIEQLDQNTCDPLVMRYFTGLTYKEIAATLGLNISTVSTRIARGLNALRNSFSQPVLATSNHHIPTGDLAMYELNEHSAQSQQNEQKLVSDWKDRWFVYFSAMEGSCGIGRRFVNVRPKNGVTQVGSTMYMTGDPCASGYPENEPLVVSMQSTIDLVDVPTLNWMSYESVVKPNDKVRERGYHGSHISVKKHCDALEILDNTKEHKLSIPRNKLVLPSIFSELFVCSQEHTKDREFSFLLFGFNLIDGEREWATSSLSGRFVGRKGSPDGMHPTYEYSHPNRLVSVWTDEQGRFLGFNDDRESLLVFESEDRSRSFLQSRT